MKSRAKYSATQYLMGDAKLEEPRLSLKNAIMTCGSLKKFYANLTIIIRSIELIFGYFVLR